MFEVGKVLDLTAIKAMSRPGTWDGNSYTQNGVTFTFNVDDGGNVDDAATGHVAGRLRGFGKAKDLKLTRREGLLKLDGFVGLVRVDRLSENTLNKTRPNVESEQGGV